MPPLNYSEKDAPNLTKCRRISKPFWFVNPQSSKFTAGEPSPAPKIEKPIVLCALKKSLCGLLRMAGFSEISESALIMFADGVDQFLKLYTDSLKDILVHEGRDKENTLDVMTLEKGYHAFSGKSLTSLANYWKDIVNKNLDEIAEFKDSFNEYDKLMQENLRTTDIKEEDYFGVFDQTQNSFDWVCRGGGVPPNNGGGVVVPDDQLQ